MKKVIPLVALVAMVIMFVAYPIEGEVFNNIKGRSVQNEIVSIFIFDAILEGFGWSPSELSLETSGEIPMLGSWIKIRVPKNTEYSVVVVYKATPGEKALLCWINREGEHLEWLWTAPPLE